MADDMSNNNDAHQVAIDVITAQLGERVTNLGRQTDCSVRDYCSRRNFHSTAADAVGLTR